MLSSRAITPVKPPTPPSEVLKVESDHDDVSQDEEEPEKPMYLDLISNTKDAMG